MFERFKNIFSYRSESDNYSSLINKNFNLDTNFIKIATVNVTKPTDLYISNLKGPSWIMIKIINKEGMIVESPTTGIKVGQTGGPYTLSVGKSYTIYVKAGTKGSYHLQVKQHVIKLLLDQEINLTTGWSQVYEGNTLTGTKNLSIRNVSGPDYIMVKIVNKDGLTIEQPSSGIKLAEQGGPYHINNGNQFKIYLKAGTAGTYHIVITY